MRRREFLAAGAVVGSAALAGCSGFGSATSESGLQADATYDWATDADATFTLKGGEYEAVYTLEDSGRMRIYQSTRYGDDRPIGIRAVQFRYPDGTVVDATEMEIEETRSEVYVTPPAEDGQLAYTAGMRSRNFETQMFTSGSYEVILPSGYRIDNFILGTARPGGHATEIVDDRLHIYWDDVSNGSVTVRYYQESDIYLFGGIAGVASIGAVIGLAYVWRQVKELQRRREEMGLDVDIDDDDRDQPPPGM